MKLLLKDFQFERVEELTRKLRLASNEARRGEKQSVCLSSPTGSGKTVMVTAAIEAILKGDSSAPPIADAAFLWITDQPDLNEQTRRKMVEASSVLTGDRLKIIDATFDEETFWPGVIHFLNIQKLGKDKSLITKGDSRTFTIWDTVNNTLVARPGRFFVVIDEAHRGMNESTKARKEATSIVQKFIKGSPGEIEPVPLIFGVSATPERFLSLVRGAPSITTRTVDVPAEEVRASGLIKEAITLYHQPETAQPADMTMLREAVRTWQKYTRAWARYSDSEPEAPTIQPILVVQVQDGSKRGRKTTLSRTDIAEAVRVIRETAGGLPDEAFAHSFQEGGPVEIGANMLRYVPPPDVQRDPDLRVVFFKTSLSTGWDCPRAEVMMSFRSAADATLIAQLVGRMVRTPLARRIESDETLNTVSLYLPHYNQTGLDQVVERLTKADAETMPPVDIRRGNEILTVNKATKTEAYFALVEDLPSYVVPRPTRSSQIRRLMKLARLLASDELDEDAPETAIDVLLETLGTEHKRLKKTKKFKQLVVERSKVQVKASNFSVGTGELTEGETIQLDISSENLEDVFDAAGRKLGEGLHKTWWRGRVRKGSASRDTAKLELIALCFLEEDVVATVEKRARGLVQDWLKAHSKAIRALPESARQNYRGIQQLAPDPEETSRAYPNSIEVCKSNQLWEKHLYAQPDGKYPAELNGWEQLIIDEELRAGAVAWLRNSPRKPWSLAIPYALMGEHKALYPDFLVLRDEGGDIVADILDPHNVSLEDAPAKAVGLANYAAKHGSRFGRIELIIVLKGKPKRLDLTDEAVRDKVKRVTTTEHLRMLYEDS